MHECNGRGGSKPEGFEDEQILITGQIKKTPAIQRYRWWLNAELFQFSYFILSKYEDSIVFGSWIATPILIANGNV